VPRLILAIASFLSFLLIGALLWIAKQRYGNVTKLMARAETTSGLSAWLQEFKHIGPVTARIFTREAAPIWYGSRRSSPRVS